VTGGEYLAIDWGTTNRRIYRMRDDGSVVYHSNDERGVLAMEGRGFAEEVASLRQHCGELPVIAAGMVGSTRGWIDVPYCPAPASLADLANAAASPAPGVSIIPGVSHIDGAHADVMRGEEVQVLGAAAAGMVPPDGLFCQPGTHCKWITLGDGRITGIATAITGEMFALLKSDSILSEMLVAPVSAGAAFTAGVERGRGTNDLLGAMFGVRASVLLGTLDREDAASFLSGVLIGSDVGARGDLTGTRNYLLGAGPLAKLYAEAIAQAGAEVVEIDATAAFTAGIHALHGMIACPA